MALHIFVVGLQPATPHAVPSTKPDWSALHTCKFEPLHCLSPTLQALHNPVRLLQPTLPQLVSFTKPD
jgi:hypothetical protein